MVAGTLALDMEAWGRFREESEVAMKPAGVRVVELASAAACTARERSRRALAFRRFSSWELLVG